MPSDSPALRAGRASRAVRGGSRACAAALDPCSEPPDDAQPLERIGYRELRGRRGRGRAHVCGKIGDGEIESWPTPQISGMEDAAMTRAKRSSLNAHRSSSEPPPRARIEYIALRALAGELDGRGDLGGRLRRPAPATGIGQDGARRRSAAPARARHVAHRRAARRGDHADAPRQRPAGRACVSAANSPSAASSRGEFLEPARFEALRGPASSRCSTSSW